jgi:catalase
MSPDEQQRLIQNIVGSLRKVPSFIQERMMKHILKADINYGEVAKELRISI